MALTYEQLQFLMMAFVRAGALMSLAPVFSGRTIPARVRVVLCLILAISASNRLPSNAPLCSDVVTLILAGAHEMIVGLLMGLGVRLIFYAIEMAGQIISTEVGLVMSSQIDPISQQNSTAIGTLLFYFGSLLFLLSGAHHAMFLAFIRSFELAPPGIMSMRGNAGELFVVTSGNIFLIAVQIAAPLMAVNFIVTLTFAILGKAAPSINIFSESSAVRIMVGIALLGLTFGLTAQLVLSHIHDSPELMLRLIP